MDLDFQSRKTVAGISKCISSQIIFYAVEIYHDKAFQNLKELLKSNIFLSILGSLRLRVDNFFFSFSSSWLLDHLV